MIDYFFNFNNSILVKNNRLFDLYLFINDPFNHFNDRLFDELFLDSDNLLNNRYFYKPIYNFLNFNSLDYWFFNCSLDNINFLLNDWSFTDHLNFYNLFENVSYFDYFFNNFRYFNNSILSFNNWNYFFNYSIYRHLFHNNFMLN